MALAVTLMQPDPTTGYSQVGGTAGNPMLIGGPAAHGGAVTGNPVRFGGRAVAANYAAVSTGQLADIVTTLVGAQISKPYSIPESDWRYAGATGGITTAVADTMKAAAAAGIRNYCTGIQFHNSAAVASEIAIRDGAAGAVLWRGRVTASMTQMQSIAFNSPIRGSAATLMEVVVLTTGTATVVSAQGYEAP